MVTTKDRDRATGNQRPSLVERKRHDREADRGGHPEQPQRGAARPLEEPVAQQARFPARVWRLSTLVMHLYAHRLARPPADRAEQQNPKIDS
jgi:hypothetical protein